MGKVEEGQSSSTNVESHRTEQNAESLGRVRGFIQFRCVLALLLGVAVLLSAIFWLPPFLQYGDQMDLDLDSYGDHDMVASFMLNKPVSLLEDNILKLEDDIFDEFESPATKVEIVILKPLGGSNTTLVVFAIVPDEKYSVVSSTAQSLIRSSFASLVTRQYPLRLTASLFGNPFSFEVLKFPGGITIIPPQSAFLLQKVQILFNFTLNFSISQMQENFKELGSQLKSGLHLTPYENLYIKLTNSEGSTVTPPTTIQASVLPTVGNPTLARLKQLAQTITGPHAKNLGLNNTVFGRVKQVRLSSILQHSLGGDAIASPTPAPLPHHPHHHHRHHHHSHHHDVVHAPTIAPAPTSKPISPATEKGFPAPAPAPATWHGASDKAKPPGCQFGYTRRIPRKANKQTHMVPPVLPPAPRSYAAFSPRQQVNPPAPVSYRVPASSPLPNAAFAHVQPPENHGTPDINPSVSISPSSTSAGLFPPASWTCLYHSTQMSRERSGGALQVEQPQKGRASQPSGYTIVAFVPVNILFKIEEKT
ncbi:hypothetical protein NMG60_11001153 [Bertholletia excelsa]